MSSIRKVFITATGIAATGIAAASFAGVNAGMMDQMNNRGSSSSQSSAPSYSPPPSSAPSYSSPQSSAPSYSAPQVQRSAPSQSQPNFRNNQQNYRAPAGPNPRQQQSSAGPRPAAPSSAPSAARESQSRPNFRNSPQNTAPVVSNPRPQASSGQQTPNGASTSPGSSEQRGGVIGRTLSRTLSTGTPGSGNGGGHHNPGNPGNPGGHHDDDDNHHPRPRPPNVVYVLPPYYYDYYWGGNLYYNFNGGWYSPYGGSYVSVGRPYGLYTRSLPANYSSFYYDDMRYYLHEDTYYTYDRSRGGYVVTPSPYGEDEEGADQDIFVYPAQGQSETQLADDRYACHRWAVRESGYDPLDDEYDRDRRANYMRALTACLEGRGYTVK
jgi:hypothetical protein